MKSHKKEIWINKSRRREFINITHLVEEELSKSGIQEGLLLVNTKHIEFNLFY